MVEEMSNRGYNKFDIIIAQNVFAHVDNPLEFLRNCKKIMGPNSILYIQTSQANMILNGEFDTAYHEHLSFFNTNSMKVICERAKLHLNRVTIEEIHGKSFLFEIRLNRGNNSNDSNITERLVEDIEKDLYCDSTYISYNIRCELYKHTFMKKLLKYKLSNYTIIAYGSTAKFNTLLNYCNINSDMIKYIIDENKLKQGLLTPGSNIMVESIERLNEIRDNTIIIISAWNFYNEIKEKIKQTIRSNLHNVIIFNINPIYTETLL
jgi:hypothetical protein